MQCWVWLEVVLLASGKEKVEWKENGTTHTGCVEFFKKKIVLYCVERVLQPSTYEFAFEYQLPENLPGSFDAKKDSAGIVAKIEYSMSGTVIVDGVFARDLMKKAILVLYTSRVGQLARPSIDTCRRKVTYLCFDRGTCAFKAAADKTLYDTTDTPNIHVDIQNGSSENVQRIQCCLVRRDVLTASDGATKTCHTTLCDVSFPGVPAHAVVAQDLPFALTTKELSPSTKGSHIEVTYVIHVLCDLPRTSSDILLVLPIEISTPTLRAALPSPSTSTPSTQPRTSPLPSSSKPTIVIPTDGTTAQTPIVMPTNCTVHDLPERGATVVPQAPTASSTPRATRASMAVIQPAPPLQPPLQRPPVVVAVAPATSPGQMQPMQTVPYSPSMQPQQFGMAGQGGMMCFPATSPQMMAMVGHTMHMVMQHPSTMVRLPGYMGQPQLSPTLSPIHPQQPVAMWPSDSGINLDNVSVDGGGPADVHFVNCTPLPMDLVWVDTAGLELFYARVNPSESYMQPTFTNHMWKVGQCGQAILTYRVRVGRQRVEVLGPGLANYC
ncbi:hypothetical protein, variant [Aphanomyces invadans]|uniref:Arrestin C-terminal-like domain-containing protein n=1 Tax=Aphanomyces invadans TaxID=157072 RepID=A0A024ULT1_9STRA|nr:hypothetical protein, variant [Aphanomyces invadans]ETW06807.1 hypothetical protein, variant [Aphanomyces invadans]|eukprot:XP_008864882.1 hypothetical protein, variant [Aphanomyces invadans]